MNINSKKRTTIKTINTNGKEIQKNSLELGEEIKKMDDISDLKTMIYQRDDSIVKFKSMLEDRNAQISKLQFELVTMSEQTQFNDYRCSNYIFKISDL